jgi:sialidase-1
VSVIEIIVLVLAFVFYSTVLIYNNVKLLIDKSKGKELHFDKGMVVTGLVFLFLATSFSLKIAVYNPQWTDGVTHTALFSRGDQKGHSYRIPSLIILPGDILLAFSESRIHAMLDWGDIDLVMKRSIDGGQTWSDLTIIRDEGKRTAGNPCPVFDNDTQTVWLPYCVDNKEVYIMNSTDYGLTWSTPREITQDLNLDLSGSTSKLDMEYGTGPGNGIQLSSGRLVIPSYYIDKKMAHVIYSDDNGQTWEKGEDLTIGEEPQVFEGVNSSLCINCRTIEDYRYVAWSSDGGETWGTPYLHQELPEIGCMASVSRFTSTITHTQNRILFSNPIQNSRGHLTIRLSYDEGLTWNVSKLIFEGPTAYSHIAILSDYTICMLFEQGRYDYRQIIQFCSFTLDWLTDGQDTLVAI